MAKQKQVIKSFPLDAEAQEAVKILTEKGFNVSHLLRELIKQEARKQVRQA